MKYSDVSHDTDSSKDVWDLLYKKVYLNIIDEFFDLNTFNYRETSSKCRRWYLKLNANLQNQTGYKKFKIAGDCDFNFNSKKILLYKKFITENDYGILMDCANMHHDLTNFSFMPITGGLNNKKGILKHQDEAKSLDRFDLFINKLNSYYEKDNGEIFMPYNKNALKWYLDKFKDIYDYCEKIYHIDNNDFIKEIINSGEYPINSRESALHYMSLAQKYWKMKNERIKSFGVYF